MEGTPATKSSSSKTRKEKLSPRSRREKLIESFKEVIFKGRNRLEVYKIIIDEIHGDHSSIDRIWISCSLSINETIYKREEGEDIPIGKPIRLRGPSRSPSCNDPVEFYFGPEEWYWAFTYGPARNYPNDPNPSCQEVTHENGSKARVFYQKIPRSVEADIEITFCYEDLGFQIQGEIFATTEGRLDTKRVLVCLDDQGTYVIPNIPLTLDRSVVALSLKSQLHISFDLSIKDYDRKFQLKLDDVMFEVPEGPKVDLREVPVKVSDLMQKKLTRDDSTIPAAIPEDFKIKVQVTWSNDMTYYYDEQAMAEFHYSSPSGSEDSD